VIRTLSRYGHVFAGHDAGHYTLPTSILDSRASLKTLEAVDLPAPPNEGQARQQLVDAFRTQAGKPKPSWPNGEAVVQAQQAAMAHAALVEAKRAAVEQATESFALLVGDSAHQIICEHLRPALEELLPVARDAALATADTTDDTNMLLRMREEYRDAWFTLDKLSTRLAALRGAQEALHRDRITWDARGEFFEMRNFKSLWPNPNHGQPPWAGMSSRARLRYLLTSSADLWMPTATERDELWQQRYGAIHAAQAKALERQHRRDNAFEMPADLVEHEHRRDLVQARLRGHSGRGPNEAA